MVHQKLRGGVWYCSSIKTNTYNNSVYHHGAPISCMSLASSRRQRSSTFLGNDLEGKKVKPLLFLPGEEGSTEGNTGWEMWGEVLSTTLPSSTSEGDSVCELEQKNFLPYHHWLVCTSQIIIIRGRLVLAVN